MKKEIMADVEYNMDKICRSCLAEVDGLEPLSKGIQIDAENITINELVTACTDVMVIFSHLLHLKIILILNLC